MDITKKQKIIIPIVAILLLIGVFGGCTEQSQIKSSIAANSSTNSEEKTVAVVTRDAELNLINLKSDSSITTLDKGGMFSHPIIAPDKNYVAYLKDKILYISTMQGKKSKMSDTVPEDSYTWLNKNDLIYSPESGGIYIFDAEKQKSIHYLDNEFNYKNITLGTDGRFYAEKYRYYDKDGSKYVEDYGVVLFQQDSKNEQIIIQSIPADKNSLGMYPVIGGTSKDLRFLYIWEHPHAGSLATDGMNLSSYDTKNDKYMQYPNLGLSLGYKDNLSACVQNSEQLALINGGGREMNSDKTLSILNLVSGNFEKFSPEPQVAMTPDYSPDCKNILYAASDKLDGIENIGKWVKTRHSIYSINTQTKQITQLTNESDGFDFAPIYINDKDIVFFRITSDGNVALWKLQNGKENKIIDNLTFYSDKYHVQDFYGHFYNAKYTDIK